MKRNHSFDLEVTWLGMGMHDFVEAHVYGAEYRGNQCNVAIKSICQIFNCEGLRQTQKQFL